MRGKVAWQKEIKCIAQPNAKVIVHITKSENKRIKDYNYVNPNRIGIDFDGFNDSSHDYIPNLNLADLISLIQRLNLLKGCSFRDVLKEGKFIRSFGVELDSRRKIDFEVESSGADKHDQIKVCYEDNLRKLERFKICSLEDNELPEIINALKEAFVQYTYYMNRFLILEERV